MQIFGPQDWIYYLLSQIFVIISFYYVFKFSNEIFNNKILGLISVLLLEAIWAQTIKLDRGLRFQIACANNKNGEAGVHHEW